MAEDSDLERTEAATGRKIEQAREQGNVPHSRELSTFAILMTGVVTISLMGSYFYQGMYDMMANVFTFGRAEATDSKLMGLTLLKAASDMLTIFAPLGLALFVATIGSNLLISGWNFSAEAVQFNPSKINPLAGIARMFSTNSAVELFKAVLKSAVIGGMSGWMLWRLTGDLLSLPAQPLELALNHTAWITLQIFLAASAAFALIAIVDVPFQLWHYYYKLRMTKQEVIDENKQTQGDPHIKSRIRRLQREMARRRMMAEVPKAEVVVTNPTHYAVALRYDNKKMNAPQVVAKGSQLVAARIKEIAREHGVPVVEAPPLARALHGHVEIGDIIPNTLFTAVAQVLAYVYQLKQPGLNPDMPSDWLVPAELDPEGQA